jgi:hypothetical protein
MGLKFERLVDDDKERLSPDEVVLRARRIARGQGYLKRINPGCAIQQAMRTT